MLGWRRKFYGDGQWFDPLSFLEGVGPGVGTLNDWMLEDATV